MEMVFMFCIALLIPETGYRGPRSATKVHSRPTRLPAIRQGTSQGLHLSQTERSSSYKRGRYQDSSSYQRDEGFEGMKEGMVVNVSGAHCSI